MSEQEKQSNHLGEAAREAASRDEMLEKDPEPSLARRFGQIGILGWTIVIPILAGVVLGRWIDHFLHSGIVVTSALTMLGAVLGMWLALRWMHEQ